VEGDALDDAGNLLGRGSAFWDRGVHVWESFSHGGSALRIPEIVLAGRGAAAFVFKQTVPASPFANATHGIALIA
jgi:hypothetical protein